MPRIEIKLLSGATRTVIFKRSTKQLFVDAKQPFELTLDWLDQHSVDVITDVPGLCAKILGARAWEAGSIIHKPPPRHQKLEALVAQLWLTNQELGARTGTSASQVSKWCCSKWNPDFFPIPLRKWKKLQQSLAENPPSVKTPHPARRRKVFGISR